ncbi:MAG: amidohydrolase family protein [Acidimicrobiia bacterium]
MQKLISADDHLVEPASLWQDRLPEALRGSGPRLIDTDEGSLWLIEDRRYPLPRKNEFVSGRTSAEHFGSDEHSFKQSELLPPFYDPAVRADLMRGDGIVGSVCFPTLPRFSGTLFLELQDTELALACVRAWNDFLFEEWCGAAPDFYIPMVMIPLWDPAAAAVELERCAALGARAVTMPENPVPLGLPSYYDPYWDPVWRVAEEAEIAVCMHIGTSGEMPVLSPEAPFTAVIVASETNCIKCLVNLLFSPVPLRYPKLQFVLSESGLGWIPSFLERSDREWRTHGIYEKMLPVPPSEVFRRSFYGCFVGDPVAVAVRHLIGVDRMLWESDYPHAESPVPHSQKVVADAFAGVPQDEVDLITHGNAAKLFRWST